MSIAIALLDSLFSPCHVRDGLRVVRPHTDIALGVLEEFEPAAPLLGVHDSKHLFAFAAHLRRIVDSPTEVVRLDGYRFTHVLGRAVFARRPDGVFDLYFWRRPAEHGRWTLRHEPDDRTPLLDLPRGSLWLDDFRKMLVEESRSRIHNAALADQWAAWAWEIIERRVIRSIDYRRLRSLIRGALELDSGILHTLRKRRRHSGGPAWFVIEYNRELRRRETTKTLETEAPSLLPLYQGLATYKDFDASLEPKRALQRLAASRGVKPRTWKWLAQSGRHGAALFQVASREFFPWDEARNALEYLDVLAILAPARRPSADTLRQILSSYSTRPQNPASYANPMRDAGAALRHIVRLLERPATLGEPARDPQELHAVLAWTIDCSRREFDRAQRQGGWAWLLRQATQHRLDLQRKASTALRWRAPTCTIETGAYRIVPLSSAQALWDEAIAMRHCADNYVGASANGQVHLFSIRNRREKRLATVCLKRDSVAGWSLQAIRGKANSEPSAAVSAVVEELLARVNPRAESRGVNLREPRR